MMMRTILFALLMTGSTISLAENWIALGSQDIHGELDLDSIDASSNPARADMRVRMEIDGDILVMHQAQEIYCDHSVIYLASARVQKVGHPKVVNMPDLPEDDRVTRIPAGNPGLNAMFDYICKK